MPTFYLLYGRKTSHHKWNIYNAALTLERVQFLSLGLRKDAPTWEIVIMQTDAPYPKMDAWNNVRIPVGKLLETVK